MFKFLLEYMLAWWMCMYVQLYIRYVCKFYLVAWQAEDNIQAKNQEL